MGRSTRNAKGFHRIGQDYEKRRDFRVLQATDEIVRTTASSNSPVFSIPLLGRLVLRRLAIER